MSCLSQAAARHLGTLIKRIGDEIICTFIAASDAASAAIDMQRSVQQAVKSAQIAVKTLKIRTGFHCGPIIARHADVFGDAVNVAARVVAHAKPGQILFTKQTLEKLADGVAQVRYVGNTPLKGKKQPLELFEVIWERDGLTQVHPNPARRYSPDRQAQGDDARARSRPGVAADGTRRRKRIRRRRSLGLAHARAHRVSPRSLCADRSEPERHLPPPPGNGRGRAATGSRSRGAG